MRREDSKNWKAKAEVDYSSYKKYVRGKLEIRHQTSGLQRKNGKESVIRNGKQKRKYLTNIIIKT
jgi:hypothetical protein